MSETLNIFYTIAREVGPIFGLILILMIALGVSGYWLYKKGFRLLGGFLGLLTLLTLVALVFLAVYSAWAWFYYATGGH